MFKTVVAIKNYLYDTGRLRPVHSSAFVICVGNITWGGTGKTTLIIQMAQRLLNERYRVAVISRGYRRKSSGLRVVSDGERIYGSWREAGDEPYLIAQSVPSAIVVVAKKRSEAFRFVQKYSPQIILLDDGFQHRRAGRDLDIVLIDASEDLQKQRMIPFGKLREPISSLRRADAVVLTHSRNMLRSTERWLRNHIDVPYFRADYFSKQDWNGKKVAAFCGIGGPQHFFDLLKESGAKLLLEQSFHDHHIYSADELLELEREARIAGADALVTTSKDAVRLPQNVLNLPLMVAEVDFRLDEEDEFYRWLQTKIQQRISLINR